MEAITCSLALVLFVIGQGLSLEFNEHVKQSFDSDGVQEILKEILSLKETWKLQESLQLEMRQEINELNHTVNDLKQENGEQSKLINQLMEGNVFTDNDQNDFSAKESDTPAGKKPSLTGPISNINATFVKPSSDVRSVKTIRRFGPRHQQSSRTTRQFDKTVRSELTPRGSATQRVAFTAYMDHPLLHHDSQAPIIYNQILLNEGNGYNKFSGMFTVPVSGIYFFTWSCIAHGQPNNAYYEVFITLVVNDVPKTTAVAQTTGNTVDDQGSSTVLAHVNAGDVVYTKHHHGEAIHGGPTWRTTSFSGFLVFSD